MDTCWRRIRIRPRSVCLFILPQASDGSSEGQHRSGIYHSAKFISLHRSWAAVCPVQYPALSLSAGGQSSHHSIPTGTAAHGVRHSQYLAWTHLGSYALQHTAHVVS